MAKHSPINPERSKVRIFFVEADLAPGDMDSLTQALTSAMRPTPAVVRGALPKRLAESGASGSSDGVAEAEIEPSESELIEQEDGDAQTPSARGPARPRKYRKPKPVDINMDAGSVSFVDFAKEKAPTSHRAKYLVAAAWLHDHANIKTITPDHVYTCYQVAGWTFDVVDPAAILRQLANDGRGAIKKSNYGINHIGLADVVKMNTGSPGGDS